MRNPRPYRSRKIPACTRCRARRSKCTIEAIGSTCLECRRCGARCSAGISRPSTIRERTRAVNPESSLAELSEVEDLQVVPPVVARDTQVLEGLIDSQAASATSTTLTYARSEPPVYHVCIPPPRQFTIYCSCSEILASQFMQQIEPHMEDLIQLYLNKIQPCLPMFDEDSLRKQLAKKGQPSRTFLINFAAYVAFYWNQSARLTAIQKPDQDFAWQVASSEMNADVQTSNIASVVWVVLNIAGRPSKGMVCNMASVARIVALSNSIGLNHDCINWSITESEKKLRQKVWWAVLVHDRWFHFAQGTPPLINADHYDVSLPTLSILVDPEISTPEQLQSAQCYIAFCQLTEIVGDVLPLVYHVRARTSNPGVDQVPRSHSDLDAWFRDLPQELTLTEFKNRPHLPGLVNLQLSYLSVRMLLERLLWYEKSQSSSAKDDNVLDRCQQAAEDIVEFVASLKSSELADFWLPYQAQHFVSAVSLLLRCALKTDRTDTRTRCMDSAQRIIRYLQKYRDTEGWDMADVALLRSENMLKRVEDALPRLQQLDTNMGRSQQVTREGENAVIVDENAIFNQWFDPLGESSLEELFPELFASFGPDNHFDKTS